MKPAPFGSAAPPIAAMPPLRVLVVDDHSPTLTAVAALLDHEYPLIDVIGTAENVEKALRISREAAPDVVVLDLDLGTGHALDLMPEVGIDKGVTVVIFSSSDDPAEWRRAQAAGASAFVSKLSPVTELIAAILATRSQHKAGG